MDRIRSATVALTAVLLAALTGCGNADIPRAGAADPSPKASSTAAPSTPAPSAGGTAYSVDVGGYCAHHYVRLSGPAAGTLGTERVRAAFCEMADLQVAASSDSDLLRQNDLFTADQFAGPRAYMTAAARRRWDMSVRPIVAGHFGAWEAMNNLLAFMYFRGNGGSGLHLPDHGPLVDHRVISAPYSWVYRTKGRTYLAMRFRVIENINLLKDGTNEPRPWLLGKSLTFTLLPNPDKSLTQVPWLVDGWWITGGGRGSSRS